MATGSTNVVNTAEGKFTWELAEQFDENETYYERLVNQLDKTDPLGTYILFDKAYITPLRTSSSGNVYGNSGSGEVCFRLEQRRDTGGGATGPFWNCYGFNVKSITTMIFVYFRTDSGSVNGNDAVHTYGDMPDVIMNTNYDGEYNRSLISIFDSSVLGSLMTFVNLAAVKVSDKVMGVDYNTRAELLELENRTSIEDWVNSLITYSEIDLTSSTFIPYKYWIKKPVE